MIFGTKIVFFYVKPREISINLQLNGRQDPFNASINRIRQIPCKSRALQEMAFCLVADDLLGGRR